MPTRGRGRFVCQAIKYFSRQDYPNKQLIIVDDSPEPCCGIRQASPSIRYIHLEQTTSLGEKRNIAVAASSGEFIAHWDDDDWYDSTRLSAQLDPLIRREADVTGLSTGYFYDVPNDQFWRINRHLHAYMMAFDINCGTIAYQKPARKNPFPSVDLGEDAMFLEDLASRGLRISKLPNRGMFVYVRHDSNTWEFECGRHLDPLGWRKIVAPKFLPEDDLRFYRQLE